MTTQSLAFICQENSLFFVLLIFCAGIVTGMILNFIYKITKLGENKQ
jgi:hypothetical protein